MQKFGRLTFVKECGRNSAGAILWECLCDCGNIKIAPASAIKRGNTHSCGCLKRRTVQEQFDNYCTPLPITGCLIWTGPWMPKGYGAMSIATESGRTNSGAHRFSWELHYGKIPEGMSVLHKCDVRCCVNPLHLFLGTSKDNTDDMVAKGREGFRRPKPTLQGEKHFRSKLTIGIVLEIKSSPETTAQLARTFNVSESAVRSVRRGLTWKHAMLPKGDTA